MYPLFIGGTEIIFILLIVFLLFGSKSIPQMARTLGSGYKQFQKAADEIKEEIAKASDLTDQPEPKKPDRSPDDLKG